MHWPSPYRLPPQCAVRGSQSECLVYVQTQLLAIFIQVIDPSLPWAASSFSSVYTPPKGTRCRTVYTTVKVRPFRIFEDEKNWRIILVDTSCRWWYVLSNWQLGNTSIGNKTQLVCTLTYTCLHQLVHLSSIHYCFVSPVYTNKFTYLAFIIVLFRNLVLEVHAGT